MGLTAKERRSATKVTAARYQKATKKLKGIILEEFELSPGMTVVTLLICSELMARRCMSAEHHFGCRCGHKGHNTSQPSL